MEMSAFPFMNYIGISSYAKGEERPEGLYIEIKMNYCPVCGRSLHRREDWQ